MWRLLFENIELGLSIELPNETVNAKRERKIWAKILRLSQFVKATKPTLKCTGT